MENSKSDEPLEVTDVTTTDIVVNPDDWQCSCGKINNGNVCTECGKSRPGTDIVTNDTVQQYENASASDIDEPFFGRKKRSEFVTEVIVSLFFLWATDIFLFGGALANAVDTIHYNKNASILKVLGSMGSHLFWLAIVNIILPLRILLSAAQRLHDIGHKGILAILLLVPPIDICLFVYLALCPGKPYKNEYGAPLNEGTLEFIIETIVKLIIWALSIWIVLYFGGYIIVKFGL